VGLAAEVRAAIRIALNPDLGIGIGIGIGIGNPSPTSFKHGTHRQNDHTHQDLTGARHDIRHHRH
jgi:hypothetical protein